MKIYILYIGVILAFLISNLYVFMQNRRIQSLNEDFKTYVQKSNERIYELLVQKENRFYYCDCIVNRKVIV